MVQISIDHKTAEEPHNLRVIIFGVLTGQTRKGIDTAEANRQDFTAQHLRAFLIAFVQQATLCRFGLAIRHHNALFGEPQSDSSRDNQTKIADDRTPGFQIAQPILKLAAHAFLLVLCQNSALLKSAINQQLSVCVCDWAKGRGLYNRLARGCYLQIHDNVLPAAALLHGPEQIADLPVPVVESPGAVRIGHPERGHLVEYLAPNSVFNSLPRQRSCPHLGPDDRFVTIDRVLHHASLGAA